MTNISFVKRRTKAVIIIMSLLSIIKAPVSGESKSVILGLYGNEDFYTEQAGQLSQYPNIEGSALFNYRTILSENLYLALTLNGDFITHFYPSLFFLDEENLQCGLIIETSAGDLNIDTYVNGSFFGNEFSSTYVYPGYAMEFAFGENDIQPLIGYKGAYLCQQIDNEDALFQSGWLGFTMDTALLELEINIGAGYEGWFEYPVYNSSGAVTNEIRQDFTAQADIYISWLTDYFFDWSLKINGSYRRSNANRYISGLPLNTSSEDRITASLAPGLNWSPSKYVNIAAEPLVKYSYYLNREALNKSGGLVGEKSYIVSIGGTLTADFTFIENIFLTFDINTQSDISNDFEFQNFNLKTRIGFEINM
ncbi:MAG: hypothetical protein JW969_10860 [Spirochaetales bacterium]|nr:hypothetical protein [Spirochaetales bacterium]